MCTLLHASTSNTVCYDVCSLLLRPQTRAVSLWSQVVSTKMRSGLIRGDLGFLNLTRMTVEWKSLSGPFFFLLCSVCLGVSSGLPEPDEDDGGMKELVGTFRLPSMFSLPGCVLFSLVLLASSEDWFSHYFSYTYVRSHSLNEQQAQ